MKLLDRDIGGFYVIFCTNYAYRDGIASLRRSGLGLHGTRENELEPENSGQVLND